MLNVDTKKGHVGIVPTLWKPPDQIRPPQLLQQLPVMDQLSLPGDRYVSILVGWRKRDAYRVLALGFINFSGVLFGDEP
jgi:hypothetical protein